MRRISFSSTFFKDILFNKTTHLKYTLVNKVLLGVGLVLNGISFFVSSLTGISVIKNVDISLCMINALLILSLITIKHRFKINDINIAKQINEIDNDSFLYSSVCNVEILPKNFMFYDDLPLSMIRKLYKEGAYVIVKTKEKEFNFKLEDNQVYLIEDDDTLELDTVKILKLSRELI